MPLWQIPYSSACRTSSLTNVPKRPATTWNSAARLLTRPSSAMRRPAVNMHLSLMPTSASSWKRCVANRPSSVRNCPSSHRSIPRPLPSSSRQSSMYSVRRPPSPSSSPPRFPSARLVPPVPRCASSSSSSPSSAPPLTSSTKRMTSSPSSACPSASRSPASLVLRGSLLRSRVAVPR